MPIVFPFPLFERVTYGEISVNTCQPVMVSKKRLFSVRRLVSLLLEICQSPAEKGNII